MRLILAATLCLATLLGCASRQPGTKDAPRGGASSQARTASPPKPVLVPINPLAGKVVLVNEPLRYVVLDFALGRPPVANQRLNVYRKGQKVGEVRISSQSRNNNFAADIMSGEARVGDEAREN